MGILPRGAEDSAAFGVASSRLKFADLIDLEWLLREGAQVPSDVIEAARPGAAAVCAERGVDPGAARGHLDGARELRAGLAAAVLGPARARDANLPGRSVARAMDLVGGLLIVVGLLIGGSSALAVLAYDGSTPVNVLHFVFVFFALQVVLLLLLIWFLLRARKHDPEDGPAFLHRPVAWFVDRVLGARGRAAAEALRVLRSRRSIYASIERWTLFALVQRFGVAFNVGALVVTMLLVTGTDLVFAWSTTLVELSGEVAHRAAQAIALPWSWCWPDAEPSLALVQNTRWVRMPGAFASELSMVEARELAAQWWRFLVAGVLTYGFLPRVAALLIGRHLRERALRTTGLDHAGYHILFDRLLPSGVGWAGPDPASVRGAPPSAAGVEATRTRPPAQPGASSVLVCWGSLARASEAVAAAIGRRFGLTVRETMLAGGAALDADERALATIGRAKPQRLVLAFAAGQQPTTDALGFVRRARLALGSAKPIVVTLIDLRTDASLADADDQERAIWRRSLTALADAHLWVEALEQAQ